MDYERVDGALKRDCAPVARQARYASAVINLHQKYKRQFRNRNFWLKIAMSFKSNISVFIVDVRLNKTAAKV